METYADKSNCIKLFELNDKIRIYPAKKLRGLEEIIMDDDRGSQTETCNEAYIKCINPPRPQRIYPKVVKRIYRIKIPESLVAGDRFAAMIEGKRYVFLCPSDKKGGDSHDFTVNIPVYTPL